MKTNLQELIQAADHLCFTLDEIIKKDREFSFNVLSELDKISMSSFCIKQNLMEIQEYIA